jgi:putative membrane protein
MKISEKNALKLILALSTLALIFLFWMIYFNKRSITPETMAMVDFLPAVNATLNALCSLCLISGYISIKKRLIHLHKRFMVSAFTLSCFFLVGYILYHFLHGETKFLTQGFVRPIYFFILISHILTSMIALPIVLYTFYLGIAEKYESHKRIASFCFFLWLYVSVTGVLVFFFLKYLNVPL